MYTLQFCLVMHLRLHADILFFICNIEANLHVIFLYLLKIDVSFCTRLRFSKRGGGIIFIVWKYPNLGALLIQLSQ